MTETSDALSAAGLLLAALALVYSAWSASIEEAINRPLGTTPGEVDRNKDDIRAVRNRRALPIAIGCWLILVVFLVRDLRIACTTGACIGDDACVYDDIAAVFLLTQLLVLGMAIHALGQVGKLNKRL